MGYEPLLTSLCTMLQAQLGFRKSPLIEALRMRMAQATQSGGRHNSRLGFSLAEIHEQEMQVRAELIISALRQARSSWSPKQLVDAHQELRSKVTELFKRDISHAAYLAAQVGGFQFIDHNRVAERLYPTIVQLYASFTQLSDEASKRAVAMVEAAIGEIVAAAENALVAHTPTERPSYVYQNTFNAPVASVAQGHASVGNANQAVGSPTPAEIADAVATILLALSNLENPPAETTQATEELRNAEGELREGKMPFGRLLAGLNVLGKAEDIALRAPEALQHIHGLLSMLGLS